jgi:DNA-binding transcriptional MerR regulator
MSNENLQVESEIACYRSGVAARLTGVPVETLRVWERRYGVVGPRLSESGQRLYSADEVHRLGMIKRLVDAGHAIGSIATLPIETLSEMANFEKSSASHRGSLVNALGPNVRIAVVGPWISSRRISEALAHSTLSIVGKCAELGNAARELEGTKADIVVIELPILDETTIDIINDVKQACDAGNGIIFYRFSPSPVLQKLRAAGYEVVRKPLDSVEVEWFCNALMRSPVSQNRPRTLFPTTEAPPPPRFDESSLAAFTGMGSGIYCECPRHLVELLLSLGSFEKYSAECANRDSADAALHQDLQWTTGHARNALEEALVRLAQAQGIELPVRVSEVV